MPEGPEVYILAKVLKTIGFDCDSVGKHLLLRDAITGELFDFSFGLAGRIALGEKLEIKKINHPTLPSGNKLLIKTKEEVKNKLGLDWMNATKSEIRTVIERWCNRKKSVGALLLDQTEICGIGVAWGSEILNQSKIQPDIKSNLLDFLNLTDELVNAVYEIREQVRKLYLNSVEKDSRKFVNSWFMNLYKIRKDMMKVYKKGDTKKVCGREFYVKAFVEKS
jgi:formamidopyrimidine-DNA glycosylase